MITDEELIQKGRVYKQLLDYPPWKMLVEEMKGICEGLKDIAVDDFEDMRLKEKGERSGILQMINTPSLAVEEMETLTDDAQPIVE